MHFWDHLPRGLLRMKYRTWSRLADDVQALIVELARLQQFRCAHCEAAHTLEVDHDHYPDYGVGDVYTVYNIRGLVCRRCNWHIGMFEKEERGDYCNWPDVYHYIDYHTYYSDYHNRVWPLVQEMLKKQLGISNYWRRRNLLSKFDDWREWGEEYPWYWGFNEIKDKKYGPIRTPKQFFAHLKPALQYIASELQKNPDYEPPDAFFELMVRLEPLFETIRPIVEEEQRKRVGVTRQP